jgi:hypothetical protein
VIDLEDANSVIWKGHTNWWLIGLSIIIFLSGLAMPLAFVLFLLGVENRVNGLRIRGDLNRMPWGRFSASTMRHHTCNEIWRFYRNVAMVWSERRALGTGDDAFAKLTPPEREDGRMDFRWGATAWAAVLALMVLALVQRVWFDNVGFSNVVFGALYLAIPLALALRRFSDGLKVAVLAVPALLTVKFPSLGWKLLPPEATQALMADYILVWIAMIVIAAAGFAISMFLNRKYALLAVALWLPFVALYLPATVLNLSIVIQVVLSALFTVLISILAGSVGSTAAATGGLREAD